MTNTLTQQQTLLKHMVEIGPITKAEAHKKYCIENVGQRIAELRERGFNIPNPARMVQRVNGGARVALYEVIVGKHVEEQHNTKCQCGKSYYSKNGRCNKCGAWR